MNDSRIKENAKNIVKFATENGRPDEEIVERHLRWIAQDFGVAIAQRIEAGVNLRIGTPGVVRIK